MVCMGLEETVPELAGRELAAPAAGEAMVMPALPGWEHVSPNRREVVKEWRRAVEERSQMHRQEIPIPSCVG